MTSIRKLAGDYGFHCMTEDKDKNMRNFLKAVVDEFICKELAKEAKNEEGCDIGRWSGLVKSEEIARNAINYNWHRRAE